MLAYLRLEDELGNKIHFAEDCERQMMQIRHDCAEELRHIQLRFESDGSSKIQLEEHIRLLETRWAGVKCLEM